MPPTETDPVVPLGDLFLRTSRQVRQRWAASLTPWDLAPHQGRALRLVAELEPVRPGVLAEHLRIAPRSVTDVVDALEERGFLERRPDPGDRRATVLHLTRAGREVREAIEASRREEADDFFGRLPDRDQAALRRILERLATEPAATGDPAHGVHPR
jgi:DNA-binding MarR family transcriptional regulator